MAIDLKIVSICMRSKPALLDNTDDVADVKQEQNGPEDINDVTLCFLQCWVVSFIGFPFWNS